MILRAATMEDAPLLCAWRNDPASRAASRRSYEIPLSEHLEYLGRADQVVSIAEVDGVPVGSVRLDCSSEVPELSWMVAPEHRRKGYGLQMVRAALHGPAVAQIKRTNTGSLAIARTLGMKVIREDDTYLWFHAAT